LFNRVVNAVVNLMNDLAARLTHRISSYTEDFASHSPYLHRFAGKVRVISPAVEMPRASTEQARAFAAEHNPAGRGPVIAMATRFAAEKGVEVLLQALPRVFEQHPNALVWFAGQHEHVLGEEQYAQRLFPLIQEYEKAGRWKFLGNLSMEQMGAFYENIDLLVVPSTNSTETFGFVQVEAMMHGKPVVASDLPGVRQPVRMTGMGRVSPLGDADQLAENILQVLGERGQFDEQAKVLQTEFSPETCAQRHEALFNEIAAELRK
jgi:glycosyltransferase involved in cell wall biosynthesis